MAVMIEDAMRPLAPQLPVGDARDQGGVLARHGGLVAVAVERPRLHLPLVELTAMQQRVERVQIVIAHRADGANLGFQLSWGQQAGHRLSSMPSKATSQPWRFTSARSGERSRSTGLELLIWI